MNKLQARRNEVGLTQGALAIEAGLPPELICRYERGLRSNQPNARRLARALQSDVTVLFPDFETLRTY